MDVARFLIRLAAEDLESEGLSQMRLHKLMYFSQGWSLAWRDQPLFDGPIEAWVHGPVVKDIYREFKHHGNRPIPVDSEPVQLEAEEQSLIESVWRGYRGFSAAGLRKKTHHELPWIHARQGCNDDQRSNQVIPSDDMRRFFKDQIQRHKIPGITLKSLQKAEQEFHSGGGVPLSEVVPGA
jgi:uncharacterized phage-associated protein